MSLRLGREEGVKTDCFCAVYGEGVVKILLGIEGVLGH